MKGVNNRDKGGHIHGALALLTKSLLVGSVDDLVLVGLNHLESANLSTLREATWGVISDHLRNRLHCRNSTKLSRGDFDRESKVTQNYVHTMNY